MHLLCMFGRTPLLTRRVRCSSLHCPPCAFVPPTAPSPAPQSTGALARRITDTDENIEATFSAVSKLGVQDVTVSYLFMRPHIRRNVSRANKGSFQDMLRLYARDTTEVQFHEESAPIEVPATGWRARRYR